MHKEDYTPSLLKSILVNNKFGRHLEDSSLPKERSLNYLAETICNLLKNNEVGVISTTEIKSKLGSLLIYRFSNWDTGHFNKKTVIIERIIINSSEHLERTKVASLLIFEFVDWCKLNDVKFVVSKISSMDLAVINVLERVGFNFIESWIYNNFNLKKLTTTSTELLELRRANDEDLAYMIEYSKNAFSTQRFHADINIPNERAEALYQKWIETSFSDPNQQVLVYDHAGIPSAFMSYSINDLSAFFNLKFAMWNMALLNPVIRGKGIGSQFFISLLAYHKNEGCDVVDSGLSLRNTTSLNLHNKLNFRVTSTLINLHLWL